MRGLLIAMASPVPEQSRASGLQYLQHVSSVVVGLGLGFPEACGIFPDQGLDSCLLQRQVDYY